MEYFRSFEYVFIVTYARSGSTLLQAILNSIPDFDIKGENNGTLFYLYSGLRHLNRSIESFSENERLVEGNSSPWYGLTSVDAVAFENELRNNFVKNILCPIPGKRVLGFKEIRHMPRSYTSISDGGFFVTEDDFFHYCDFLRSFPNSKIIFNSRNPEDVAKSGMWLNRKPEKVMNMVDVMDLWFRLYNEKHPDGSYLLQYEQYTNNISVIEDLLAFLGVEFNDEDVSRILNVKLSH